MSDKFDEMADAFTDELFTNGNGDKAERLLLTAGTRDLGGWCRGAVADRIAALVRRAVEDARAEEREDAEKYRWCIESAAWHRGEESAYVAIPVDRDADLSCAAMRDHAIAAAIRARGSKEGR